MKKTALTLAFLLSLCSFTACGSTNESDSASSKSVVSSSEEESSEEETTTEAEESEEETTEAETTEAEEEETTASEDKDTDEKDSEDEEAEKPAAAENTDFKRGTVKDNVYTNEFAGIKFTAPEGCTFAKDDYILSMMNIGLDVMGNDTAITKAMLEQVAIYDAVCVNQTNGMSIMVEFENLAKEVPDPDKFTVDDYIEAIDKQLSAQTTIKFSKKGDTETVTMAGKEFTKLVYTAEINGISMEQVYYVRREGKFMLGIIASSGQSNEDMTAYEKNFEALS